MGVFNASDAAFLCACERPRFVAEEFAVQQGIGQSTAVEGDVGRVAAARMVVQGAGHHFFARAGFTANEHIDGGVGNFHHQLPDALHGKGLAHQLALQPLAEGEGAAQMAHLQRQAAFVKSALHHFHQLFGGKGFGDEVISTAAHGLHRQRDIAVACNHDDGQIGVEVMRFFDECHATGSGQAHIGDDDTRHARAQVGLNGLDAIEGANGDVGQLQRLHAAQLQVFVVFDQKDGEVGVHRLG